MSQKNQGCGPSTSSLPNEVARRRPAPVIVGGQMQVRKTLPPLLLIAGGPLFPRSHPLALHVPSSFLTRCHRPWPAVQEAGRKQLLHTLLCPPSDLVIPYFAFFFFSPQSSCLRIVVGLHLSFSPPSAFVPRLAGHLLFVLDLTSPRILPPTVHGGTHRPPISARLREIQRGKHGPVQDS